MTGESNCTQSIPALADSAPVVHLILQKGHQAGLRIRCRNLVTIIGSRPGCRVTMPGKNVSPVHVAICCDGNKVLAIDLMTPHGTLLNGLKMEHEELGDGDMLTIEPWVFRVEIVKTEANGNGDLHLVDFEPAPSVVAFEHLDSGRILQPNRKACILGRRQGCDITVADPNVSRVQALIINDEKRPSIVDLLSRNRTTVNGAPISHCVLKDGDVVGAGESEFKVRIVGSKMGERATKKLKVMPAVSIAPQIDADPEIDLIDIQAVEGKQRWTVADNLDRLERAAKRQAV